MSRVVIALSYQQSVVDYPCKLGKTRDYPQHVMSPLLGAASAVSSTAGTTAVATGTIVGTADTAVASGAVGTAGTAVAADEFGPACTTAVAAGAVGTACPVVAAGAGVVVTTGVNALAGTVAAGGAVTIKVADDEVSSSSAPSTALISTFDVRMKHLMQTLDFMLQPIKRTPLSEFRM